jgi:hypothetical protein
VRQLNVELVDNTYSLPVMVRVSVPATNSIRIVKHVEDHFRTIKSGVPKFGHFAPATFLFEKRIAIVKSLPDIDQALRVQAVDGWDRPL